ncbi:MAG: DMT family transporter [Chloroflexi bacterium]|nr:DMT family transporter [Chloroflexota bacterium]
MSSGLLLGLGAALMWGLTDVAAALAGRRYGSLKVVLSTQVVGVSVGVAILVAGMALGAPLQPLNAGSVAVALACGLFACIAYVGFFTALKIGPISVVSPVVSAYGGLTVLLAVFIRGETLTQSQAIGAAVSTLGVVLVGLTFDGGMRGLRVVGPGVLFALVALFGFAGLTVAIADPIREIGWLPALIAARSSNAVLSAALLFVVLARPAAWTERFVNPSAPAIGIGPLRWPIAVVLLAGVLDVGGLVSYTIGLEVSQVWLVGLASSFGPVVAVLVAVLFLGERPRPTQWLGMIGIVIGIALIGLS